MSKTNAPAATVPTSVTIEAARPTLLTKGASQAVARARTLAVITTKAEADQAGLALAEVRKRLRGIAEHYKAVKAPVKKALKEALDGIGEMEAEDLKPWQDADALLSQPILAWNAVDTARVVAENNRRIAEAEEKARADRAAQVDTLARAAQAAPTRTAQKALERQARQVAAAPVQVGSVALEERSKIAGVSVPTTKVAEVFDLRALLQAALAGQVPLDRVTVDQSWLNDQAVAFGNHLNLPGVRVVERTGLRGN